MFKKALLLAVVVSLGLGAMPETCRAVSGAGAIVLDFPIGARYNAMGEAGVALSQDATAAWWNPGGLAFASDGDKPRDLHIMQSNLAEGLADDIALYWLGYATPFGGAGTLGFSMTYLNMGEQMAVDEDQNELGLFRSFMFTFGATFGAKLTPNIGVGIGAKYFRDRLAPSWALQDEETGAGDSFGVDLGILAKLSRLPVNLAFSVTNLGPNIKHIDADQSDPMPRKMVFGGAYRVFDSPSSSLVVIADVLVPLLKWDDDSEDWGFGPDFKEEVLGFGAEWSYVQSLFLRFGYKNDHAGDIQDHTWGFGLDLNRWLGQGISFGYASVPQAKTLDRVNRFSMGFSF